MRLGRTIADDQSVNRADIVEQGTANFTGGVKIERELPFLFFFYVALRVRTQVQKNFSSVFEIPA